MASNTNLISVESLHSRLARADWRVVDCRSELTDPAAGRRAYLDGHIPGAVFVDLEQDLSGAVSSGSGRHPLPQVTSIERRLGELGIDATTHVVVYDWNTGALAARAWWTLRWLGHYRVYLLNGGLEHWLRAGYDLSHGNEAAEARQFEARPREQQIMTTSSLIDGVRSGTDLRLFDARDHQRFIGDSEPIDAVAGHIPGATNLPLRASLNADMTWKSRQQLEALWIDQLGPDKTIDWSVMCGSGVTACHLALSGVEAGYCEPTLYVGSWSEWIRDPRRPVAIGEAT